MMVRSLQEVWGKQFTRALTEKNRILFAENSLSWFGDYDRKEKSYSPTLHFSLSIVKMVDLSDNIPSMIYSAYGAEILLRARATNETERFLKTS